METNSILKVGFPSLCYFHTSETADMSHRMMNTAQPICGKIFFLYLAIDFFLNLYLVMSCSRAVAVVGRLLAFVLNKLQAVRSVPTVKHENLNRCCHWRKKKISFRKDKTKILTGVYSSLAMNAVNDKERFSKQKDLFSMNHKKCSPLTMNWSG